MLFLQNIVKIAKTIHLLISNFIIITEIWKYYVWTSSIVLSSFKGVLMLYSS